MSEKKLLGPVPSAMNNIKTMLTQHGLIMVMKAADLRNLNYPPQFRFLNGTRLRCIFR
jgi:hypothetical protein